MGMSLEWVDDWAQVPDPGTDWAHAGIAVASDGVVLTTHPNGHTLLGFDTDGRLVHRAETELLELHCLHPAGDALWVTDVGFKRYVDGDKFTTARGTSRVVRLNLDGSIAQELAHPYQDDRVYLPTAVTIDELGAIWVADGYGQDLVHRYDADGSLNLTLDGFSTPHSLAAVGDSMLVCDRANGRIQELDLDGKVRRTLAEGVVVTPTHIVVLDDLLVVTDFTAGRITVLDRDGTLVEHMFESDRSAEEDGWPNARDSDGNLVRPSLRAGAVNSPHTLAADADGNIYLSEWLIGGRTTKLAR